MKTLEAGEVIAKANRLLVEFLGRIPLSRYWGDGKSASSDMMSVATSRHLWNARLDPRRKTPSIGMYTHVHNQWPIIYNQPILLGERQVGAAIEGVVRQTDIDLDVLAVDTHGFRRRDVGVGVSGVRSVSAIEKPVGATIDSPEGCACARVVGIGGRHDAAYGLCEGSVG